MQNETRRGALIYNTSGQILLYRSSLDTSGISGISEDGAGNNHEEIIQQRVCQELEQSAATITYLYSFAMFLPSSQTQQENLSSWRFYRVEIPLDALFVEARNLAWYNEKQILALMKRTEQFYLHRDVSEDSWRQDAGLSLSWYRLFKERMDLLYPAPITSIHHR